MNEAKKRTCQASLRRAARELERRGLCMILPVLDLVQITKISTKWEVDPFGWDNEAWSYRERLVTRRRFERYRHSKVAAIARPDYAFPAHLRSNS
jgi:hypothetical protein